MLRLELWWMTLGFDPQRACHYEPTLIHPQALDCGPACRGQALDAASVLYPEDVATSGFDSVTSHVHWVYCAYILLRMSPPGVPPDVKAVGDKQRHIQHFLENKDKRHILQKLSQIGGVEHYKDELRQALAGT